MFQFNHDLLLINHGLVLISGGESPVISYLLSAEAIGDLDVACDMRFSHSNYIYLKHDELSYIWRTNTLTMKSQSTGGEGPSVLFFIWLLISPLLQTIIYLIPYPCTWKDLHNHLHEKKMTIHLISSSFPTIQFVKSALVNVIPISQINSKIT